MNISKPFYISPLSSSGNGGKGEQRRRRLSEWVLFKTLELQIGAFTVHTDSFLGDVTKRKFVPTVLSIERRTLMIV